MQNFQRVQSYDPESHKRARARKTNLKNAAKTIKKANTSNPITVTPLDRLAEYPNEDFCIHLGSLYCPRGVTLQVVYQQYVQHFVSCVHHIFRIMKLKL